MATKAAQTYLTPEEYIALERKTLPDSEIVRSEYCNREIIAMYGTSFAHNLITNEHLCSTSRSSERQRMFRFR